MILNHNKAQATTELAIFGSLILVCFAILISYGMSLQEQQILQQQTFRKALKKAYDDNAFVSYNVVKNPRTVNVFGRYGEGGRSSLTSGTSVNWNVGESAEMGYYQVNEDEMKISEGITYVEEDTGKRKQDIRFFDKDGNVKTEQTFDVDKDEDAISKFKEENEIWDVESQASTAYKGQEVRSEDGAGITSTKSAKLGDTITTSLKVKSGSDIVLTQGLDSDGSYRQSAVGTEVSKERTWITPHAE